MAVLRVFLFHRFLMFDFVVMFEYFVSFYVSVSMFSGNKHPSVESDITMTS